MEAALEQVGLGEDVAQWRDGLRTPLVPNGRPFTAGQALQLMIARALLARPRLLLVDVALSALDGPARERVTEVLFSPAAPWTLVVATHDELWLDRCDRVVWLDAQLPEADAIASTSSRTDSTAPNLGMEPAA
jgi:ABC-type transport system involved in cytochrome bd biosynthesis fused ATPase/permease subunit